ncbi:MAG: DeoR family transcriptional regulator [Ardenticatenaceae bacterium]
MNNDAILLDKSADEFGLLVEEGLRCNRDEPLSELSQLGLAYSSLVEDCFLGGETVSDKLRALGVLSVLCWGIDQLRPDGEHSWFDNKWRLYNVLYYPYIMGMRFPVLAKKMALTDANLYKRVRPKALKALSRVLRREVKSGTHVEERKEYALAARYEGLSSEARQLARMAALFGTPMPEKLLYQLAEEEGISNISASVRRLLRANLLRSLDEGAKVELHPEIRAYLLTLLSPEERERWHHVAGEYYLTQQDYLEAACHFRRMGNEEGYHLAAQTVIEHQTSITNQHPMEELSEFLSKFSDHELPDTLWFQLKMVSGDVAIAREKVDVAIAEYGQALRAEQIDMKALAYYKRAEAYRRRDLDQALLHYNEGIKLLAKSTPPCPRLTECYIGRAWFFTQARQDLERAEQDLQHAQKFIGNDDPTIKWALHNAFAGLYARREEPQAAQAVIDHRLQAWLAAEETQDLVLRMKTAINLGFDYAELLQEYQKALQYITLSQEIAVKMGDRQMEGLSTKYVGNCYYWLKQHDVAIAHYKQAHTILLEAGNLNWLISTCVDLAGIHGEIGALPEAKRYFDEGVRLAKRLGHLRYLQEFEKIASKCPGLPPVDADLNPRQLNALDYVKQHGKITKREYVELTRVSPATANRDLKDMCKKHFLLRKGQKRGTYYTQP